jgi:DNA primase small subunit
MPSAVSRETLAAYYRNAFPFRSFTMWLGYGRCPLAGAAPCGAFRRREFAFRFGDVYARFKCFESLEGLRAYVLAQVPGRLELGAVYEEKPDEPLLGRRVAQREFVIDIDLTDMAATGQLYTAAEDPADPAFACSWRLLAVAVRTLDRVLRGCFGFEHVLWVFSGRRGVHCWVADGRARRLDAAGRAAITDFLNVDRSPGRWAVFAGGQAMHPTFAAAADAIEKSDDFAHMLREQAWLSGARRERVLDLLVDTPLRAEARERLSLVSAGGQLNAPLLWHTLRSVVCSPRNLASQARRRRWGGVDVGRNVLRAVVLGLTYPVLDAAVSRSVSHLLKAPFAVHPATGRVCVPLDPATVGGVDPAALPTAEQAARDPACLRPYLATFHKRFLDPLHRQHVAAAAAEF